ncbi:hypothetical protein BJ085DRAFT_23224 [Dimargaris cristalligena]|uniref:TPR-like protein n=1 Tax=Dimargaris cristalligena TaxID=215637 RepID=A0A4P9ZPP4_9FUNG|nr:hypothetical protein BJ085DRAFT_23224 [Dimargaris cristalligena]|eukprot:RKP35323.1 hypothetical protein BJ085DRAFT_23224 [Dimargaris cristalligena]
MACFASATSPPPSGQSPSTSQTQADSSLAAGAEAFQAGNLTDALVHFQASVDASPSSAAYYNIGVCHYQLQQFPEAATAWDHSLELDPHRADVHLNLASVAFMHLKDTPRALEHLAAASRMDPQDGEIFYNYGCILESTGQLAQAIEKYQQAVDLGIERAKVNLRNAMARAMQQKAADSNKQQSE